MRVQHKSQIHIRDDRKIVSENCRLVSLVGKVPVYRAGGSGLIPGWSKTQGLKISEEKVLPLL